MENENINGLIEKYFSGEATLQETSKLKEYFTEGEGMGLQSSEALLFRMLAATREVKSATEETVFPEELLSDIEKAAEKHFNAPARHWRLLSVAAASIAAAAVVMLAVLFPPKETRLPDDTFSDPVLAKAEVINVLEIVGRNLNYCMDFTAANTERAGNKAKEAVDKIIDINNLL